MDTVHLFLEGKAGVGKNLVSNSYSYELLRKALYQEEQEELKSLIIELSYRFSQFKLYNHLRMLKLISMKYSKFRRKLRKWQQQANFITKFTMYRTI